MASKLILLLIFLNIFYTNEIEPGTDYSHDSAKKNLIIGALTNYKWDKLSVFFNSLLMTKIENCDIVFFVGNMTKETTDKMQLYGIIMYPIPEKYMKESTINIRWKIAIDYLDSNPDKYKYVFTADTRDVFFQDDPFKYYNLTKSYLGIAIEDGDLNERVNKEWIINGYGKEKHNTIKNERIMCTGTVWGTVDKFYEFSKLMWNSLNTDWSKKNNINEQAVANYIIYYDKKFNDCLEKSYNDDGYIMTIGLTGKDKMIVDSNNIVYNRKGKKAAVVHQYDRHKYLIDKINEKYNDKATFKNLIIGTIINNNWDKLSIFFNSLIMSKIENCDIVFFVGNMAKETTDKIKSYGVIVYPIPEKYMKESLTNLKWKIIMDYLDSNRYKYKYIFTADTKETFFQDNPFKYYDLPKSYLGIAIEDGDLSENFIKEWIVNAYGEEKYNSIKNERIICANIVWGTFDKFYEFSKLMWDTLNSDWSKTNNINEQAVANYIIYYDKKFNDCLVKSDNDDGYIMPIGLTKKDKMIVDSNNIVYNRKGKKAAVVYQYERHEDLTDKAIAKYYFDPAFESNDPKQPKRNLIIVAITYYNWDKIAIFFNSIKMSKIQNCDVVTIGAYMSQETIDKLKSCGVKVYLMHEKYLSVRIINSRWKIIMDYLDAYPDKYKYVFTADTRDIFFQDDPFKHYNLEKSYLGIAIEDGNLNEQFNKGWIINAYGKQKHKVIKKERIFCVGTVWGTVDKFYEFSKLMWDNLNTDWAREREVIEQGVGNYLIYYDKKFNDCLVKSDNDDGYVMTIGLTDSDKMIVDSNNIVYNRKGKKAAVVHQYDRHPDLTDKAIAKYYFTPEETSNVINPHKKNLIFGIVTGYKWEQISSFFKSINTTKFENCDIVIYIANITEDIKDKIKSCGVIVYQMDERYIKESVISSKYKIAIDYLDSHKDRYNYIFTGDVRDIYFQDDPFKYYNLRHSYLGIAIEDILIYGNLNYKYYVNKYNKDKFRAIKNEYLFFADIVWGTVDKFYQFSKIMLNNFDLKLPNEIEQIVGNHIIYYEKLFNDCLVKSSKIDGHVISIELSENEAIMNRETNSFIYNEQGKKVAVVHQYNIHKKIFYDSEDKNKTTIIITFIIAFIFSFIILFYYNKHLKRDNNIDFENKIINTLDIDEEKEEYKVKKYKKQEMKKKKEKTNFDEDLDDDTKKLNKNQ